MHIKILAAISSVPLVLVASSAFSQDKMNNIRVVTGVSLGYSDFTFPEKLDHNISFPSINIPIAITEGNWQLSINASSSLADADIAEEEELYNYKQKMARDLMKLQADSFYKKQQKML